MPILDYSDAEPQTSYDVIPDKTLAKVRMTIQTGGHNDETKGWTGGWATKSDKTGAVFLKGEFTVVEGPYANKKIWSLVGLHSPKSDKYEQMGKSLIRAILESANYIDPNDKSAAANKARSIDSFAELQGIEFVAQIDIEPDQNGNDRNKISFAITKSHKEYINIMGKKQKDNGRYKIGGNKQQVADSDLVDDELPF